MKPAPRDRPPDRPRGICTVSSMDTRNDVVGVVRDAVQRRAARAKALEQLAPVLSSALQSQALAAAADADAILQALGTQVTIAPVVKRVSEAGSKLLVATLRARARVAVEQASAVDLVVRAWQG